MRLIVTHEQPDFDALASLALAKLLYPGSVATTQGALSPQLSAFIKLYRDVLDLQDDASIDLSAVTELVVVDTADPTRIRPFDQLIGRVPITVYDHHPTPATPIPATRGISERVGAAATLLTRELAATKAQIPQHIASLALLGIHEDTGNLSFDLTTADDYRACAYLLEAGASLTLVRRFAHDELSPEQLAFRERLLTETRETSFDGRQAVVAAFDYPTYVQGVSGLISDLIEMYRADAAVVSVRMDARLDARTGARADARTLVFARSSDKFDSAAALAETIGGAGHPGAAYGRTELEPEAALATVVEAMQRHSTPALRARDLMSTPVRTVLNTGTVAAAQEAMLRFGHNGLPVLDAQGDLVGVVSRRDIDRAVRHGLTDRSVASVMRRDVVTAAPSTSLAELETLVLDNNVGRIPVLDEGRLVGIVTRADLIGARHTGAAPKDPVARLLERLPARAAQVVDEAVRQVVELTAGNAALYLVGGTVRDLLLGTGIKDLDLMVEGESAERVGTLLQQALGGTLSFHAGFGTCTLALPDGLTVDLATAREELYARPGALPEVEASDLRRDLGRRDFTINAMSLAPDGGLHDYFGGREDLTAGRVRFVGSAAQRIAEDYLRVLRFFRFLARFGRDMPDPDALAACGAAAGRLGRLSIERVRTELVKLLAAPNPVPALAVMDDSGVLAAVLPEAGDRTGLMVLCGIDDRDPLRRLAALVGTGGEALGRRLKMANAEIRRLGLLAPPAVALEPGLDPAGRRQVLYDLGPAISRDLVLLAWAADREGHADAWRAMLATARDWTAPALPLRGADVTALGVPKGPEVGRIVAAVEAWWRARDFQPGREACLDVARRLAAGEAAPP
ncbi:MAG: CBS domain-containing protein [Trueperaceae bacterium]|nr:CBS domain-containing protein [Trueperaceae bacterium]